MSQPSPANPDPTPTLTSLRTIALSRKLAANAHKPVFEHLEGFGPFEATHEFVKNALALHEGLRVQ